MDVMFVEKARSCTKGIRISSLRDTSSSDTRIFKKES
jgi:hypothetical protein